MSTLESRCLQRSHGSSHRQPACGAALLFGDVNLHLGSATISINSATTCCDHRDLGCALLVVHQDVARQSDARRRREPSAALSGFRCRCSRSVDSRVAAAGCARPVTALFRDGAAILFPRHRRGWAVSRVRPALFGGIVLGILQTSRYPCRRCARDFITSRRCRDPDVPPAGFCAAGARTLKTFPYAWSRTAGFRPAGAPAVLRSRRIRNSSRRSGGADHRRARGEPAARSPALSLASPRFVGIGASLGTFLMIHRSPLVTIPTPSWPAAIGWVVGLVSLRLAGFYSRSSRSVSSTCSRAAQPGRRRPAAVRISSAGHAARSRSPDCHRCRRIHCARRSCWRLVERMQRSRIGRAWTAIRESGRAELRMPTARLKTARL